MNPSTTASKKPTTTELRDLTARGCEVARMAAAAIEQGIGTGESLPLDFIRTCEEELDTLDRRINEGVTAAVPGAAEQDTRELLSCLKFIIELERIGDLLLNVANRARTISTRIDAQDAADLKRMAQLLHQMVSDVQLSLRDRDLKRALAILRTDAEMDRIRNLLFVRHVENPERQQRQESFHLVFMAQSLERAADHVKNVAEEICHLITGRSIRHLIREADKPDEVMFVEWMRKQPSKR
jgi:phosphate transport system protein